MNAANQVLIHHHTLMQTEQSNNHDKLTITTDKIDNIKITNTDTGTIIEIMWKANKTYRNSPVTVVGKLR